jgi:hypothetical protein
MGNLGGLSVISQQFSILQIATNGWLGLIGFSIYELSFVLRNKNNESLGTFVRNAPLQNEEDFTLLNWMSSNNNNVEDNNNSRHRDSHAPSIVSLSGISSTRTIQLRNVGFFRHGSFDDLLEIAKWSETGEPLLEVIVWHYNRTIAKKYLPDWLCNIVCFFFFTEMGLIITSMFNVIMTVLFWLSFLLVIPLPWFAAATVSLSLVSIFSIICDNDLTIASYCGTIPHVCRLGLCIIATITTGALCGFDIRTTMVFNITFNVLVDSLLESKPTQSRHGGRILGSILVTCTYLVIVILLNLGRVPGERDIVLDFGYMNGLSTIPQTYSIQQICTQAWGGLIGFSVFELIMLIKNRNSKDTMDESFGTFYKPAPLRNELEFTLMDWMAKEKS